MPKSNHSMKLPTTVPEMAVRMRERFTTSTSSTFSLRGCRRGFRVDGVVAGPGG